MKNTSKLSISDSAFIAIKNKDLKVMTFFNKEGKGDDMCGEGKYRVITKCQAGFLVTSVVDATSAINALRRYKIKAVHSIARIKNVDSIGDYEFTVFARSGKKIWVAEAMLAEFTVGDINQDLSNTALYNQAQYQAVNAKTWADKAYVMNEEVIAA
jgi:hypothetical protein